MSAHVDETLVGIMLDALHEIIIVMAQVAHSHSSPNTNSHIIERRQSLMIARVNTSEVRYLTEAVNSEKY